MTVAANLVVAPILLPLATAAVLVVIPDRLRQAKATLNLVATVASLVLALYLLVAVDDAAPRALAVYLPGNWPVPFGIVLVLDRLSAVMLVLAAAVALAALLFSLTRWQRASVHFHPLLQLQLMGLAGAFLTGDLFNLFVFFEVLLAASYGLLLHGGGAGRVRSGLHYIAVNLFASFLFLAGVALLYGVTGTLTMADIAQKLPLVPAADRGLLHAGAALLAVAFLAKAAQWPLNFWLPGAYAAASAPAACVFAILTKVGVYAVLRLWTLWFSASAGASALFGGSALVACGLATIAFGALGMVASHHLGRLAGYSVITSAGTVLAVVGLGRPALTGGALFYLASSTLAAGALFLVVELLERGRQMELDPPSPDDPGVRLAPFAEPRPPESVNLDDQQLVLVGRAIPGALALLGLALLLCMLVIAGLPPLSGFVGKLAMLTALLEDGAGARRGAVEWTLFTLLIASGLLATIALSRAFISHFWTLQQGRAFRLPIAEGLPVALLLAGCVALAAGGDRALRYMRATATDLYQPDGYVEAVMATQPRPGPEAR